MANREKNREKEPYLLSDGHLNTIDYDYILNQMKKKYNWGDLNPVYFEDFESSEYYTDTDNNDDYLEQFNDYMSNIEVGDIEEVETKQVRVTTIGGRGNEKDFENPKNIETIEKAIKQNPSGVSQNKNDGSISVTTESKIIRKNDLSNFVNNLNKINLSESEIMSILVKTQNPIVKKSELVESIQNKILNEARMNDDVRQGFESGENDYSDILGRELTNQLAQESFEEIADNIRRRTGKQDVTIEDVQRLLSTSLMSAAQEEYRIGVENLERKAVDMIRKNFNIPTDAIDFDAKITGIPPEMLVGRSLSQQQMDQLSTQAGVKVGKINREGLKMSKGTSQPPQGMSSDELKPKVKRRRLTNAMMHGSARRAQNLHHLDDQLRQENPQLGRNYSNLMSANDASYFLLDDQTIKSQGEGGIHAGNVRLDLGGERPKIIAQGMVFPILLHELAKGVVELMSLWSLPEDRAVRQYVLDKTDNLESETNDIRLGTKLWERFVQQIPADNQEVISLTWNMMQSLPDNEFNSIVEGLISNRTESQQKVRRMAEEALEELQREASDDVFGSYEDSPESEDDGDTLTPPQNDDENPIGLEPEEPIGPDYESMSKKDLQLAIDDALDAGDMDLVRYLGSLLNKK